MRFDLAAICAGLFALNLVFCVGAVVAGHPPAIWPPNAVVLVCLMRTEARWWPALLASPALGNMLGDTLLGGEHLSNLGMQLCNVGQTLLCAFALRRFVGRKVDFARLRDVTLFAMVAFVASGFVAAYATAVWESWAEHDRLHHFLTWVLSDALGLLIITPALVALDLEALQRFLAPDVRFQNLGLQALVAAVMIFICVEPQIHMRFVGITLLTLIAFRSETPGAAIGVLLTATIASVSSAFGIGLGHGAPGSLNTQGFLLCCVVTAVPVAATIGGRRRLEQTLAARAHDFQMLVDHSTDLILRVDRSDVVIYASPSARRLGYEPSQLVGRTLAEIIHPDDVVFRQYGMELLFEGKPLGPEVQCEQRVRTASGEWIWIEESPQAVMGADGRAEEVVTAWRDITERKALECELEHKRREAEAATVAKSDFLANMSHEIRTPLTAVIGFADLLEKVEALPSQAALYTDRISTAGRSLLTVVNDILDFSKLEAGQIELDPQPFEPAKLVGDTIELVRAQAAAKGLGLALDIGRELPAAVIADGSRLRQIVLNLLSNALKFTERGGVTVTVAWDGAGQGVLRVAVSDTGPGLSGEQATKLFQRFSQADASISRRHGGTGLGLAICRSLAELMGGAIGVDSVEGAGATFWFHIAAPVAAPVAVGASRTVAVSAPAPRATHILVVDDVPVNRELVRVVLGASGCQVSEAGGGAQAIQLAAGTAFDLILMDVQMPEMDGMTAARTIRAGDGANRATPIVALSADVLAVHVEACKAAGMNDHVGKPIDTRVLIEKVLFWTHPPQAADAEPEGGRANAA
jgi:PAS domain S-box-containing protein